MICPDCEMEVDKLVSTNDCCILCYKRKNNAKSRGKEYVKLKDIKGTTEYNRAMGRRLGAIKRKQKSNEVVLNKEPIKETKEQIIRKTITQIEGYEYIDIDSDDILKTLNYLNDSLNKLPEIKNQLIKIDEDLKVISHEKERTDGFEDIKFQELVKKEYSILQYRRKLKNAISILSQINTNVLHQDLIKKLEETNEYYINGVYKPKSTYRVTVNCTGLYGSTKVEPYTQTLLAKDEEEAKCFVEERLKSWHNVVIYGNSWKVEELIT